MTAVQGESRTPGGGQRQDDSSNGSLSGKPNVTSTPENTLTPSEIRAQSSGSRPDTPSSEAADSPPASRSGQRNASSKFASLRAAFEKTGGASANGTVDSLAKKRVFSNSEQSMGRFKEGNPEQDAEISRLKDGFEKEKELRMAFEDRVSSLEEEVEILKARFLHKTEELAAEVKKREQSERTEFEWAKEKADESDEEMDVVGPSGENSTSLRRQLSDLKRSISQNTRSVAQTSDTTFRQEVGLLQHEVQNWVVNNFRKVKVDASPEALCQKLERIAEPKHVERLKPIYEAFDLSAKLAIYQSTVASYIMEVFEDRFLFGLQGQREWAKRTRQAAETLPIALNADAYNRWRALTLSALRESEAIHELVESAAGWMAEMTLLTLNAMTETEQTEAQLHSLKTIMRRTISLAHQVRAQQAQYEFVLPACDEEFDAACMDDVFDDGDAETGRTVRCATFPSLYKIADDRGTPLSSRQIVFRARILCKDESDD